MLRKWKNRILKKGITIDSGYVTLRLKGADGKPYKKRFGQVSRESLDKAERKLNELSHRIDKGEGDATTRKLPILFLEAAELFLSKHGAGRSRSYKYHLSSLTPYLEKYFWHQIDTEVMGGDDEEGGEKGQGGYRAFRRAQISRGSGNAISDSSINRDLGWLGKMWNWWDQNTFKKKHGCHAYLMPSHNPAKVWRASEWQFRRRRILKDEELTVLVDYASPRLARIVVSTLTTGLRRADLFGLSPERFAETLAKIEGIQSKTGKEFNLPFTSAMQYMLETAEDDRILDATNLRREWAKARKRVMEHFAALGRPIEPFQFRDLRRTIGMAVYEIHRDIVEARDFLGHQKTDTTEIYLGIQADKLQEVGKVLDKKAQKLVDLLRAKSLNQNAQKMPKTVFKPMAKLADKSSS